MNLGEHIYQLRTQQNMSQGDFADAMEVSRQSVSKWENNSAVPELEKLVKMAEVFGITLDELVNGKRVEIPPPPPQINVEPIEKIVYIEKSTSSCMSPWTVLGAILLIAALGVGLILSNYEWKFSLMEVFLICFPIALCGVFCIVTKLPLLWCSWIASGAYWIYFFILSLHWEEMILLSILGIIFVLGSVVYTVMLHKKGVIQVQAWVWGVMALVLTGAAVLLFVNLLPVPVIEVTQIQPLPTIPYE